MSTHLQQRYLDARQVVEKIMAGGLEVAIRPRMSDSTALHYFAEGCMNNPTVQFAAAELLRVVLLQAQAEVNDAAVKARAEAAEFLRSFETPARAPIPAAPPPQPPPFPSNDPL